MKSSSRKKHTRKHIERVISDATGGINEEDYVYKAGKVVDRRIDFVGVQTTNNSQ